MIPGRDFVLKATEVGDLGRIREIAALNAEHLFWDGGQLSLDNLWATLSRSDPATSSIVWSIWKAGQIEGFVSFNHIHPVHRSAEVGYLGLHPGVGNPWMIGAVVDSVLEFGFKTLGLNRIWGKVFAGHNVLLKLYAHKHFRHEGESKNAVFISGEFRSIHQFGLLANEWRALQAARADPPEQIERPTE